MRTSLAMFLVVAAAYRSAHSQTADPLKSAPRLGISVISLKDGGELTPDATLPEDEPSVAEFLPPPGNANGTAVIVAPGGSYIGLSMILEGRQVADWFAARGIAAFVLRYRLGALHPYPVPLLDAQRAIQLVRSKAKALGLAPNKIGMMGFSAGGHLAASAGTLFHSGQAQSNDAIEQQNDRPDFVILAYPWLNPMQLESHGITYCSTIKSITKEKCLEYETDYTPALHVTSATPTTFIYATTDDPVVPVSASVDYYQALVRARVPAELHLFRHGAHGTGLGNGSASLDEWPVLLEHWLRDQNLL